MVRFVSEGIQNRIQNDYFGGAISGQKKCYISAPFLEGPISKLPALAQYSAATLRIQYRTTDLSNPPRPLFGNNYPFCFRVTPNMCPHGCKKIPGRNNTECWLEAKLRTFMPEYGVFCQSKGATFARLIPSLANKGQRTAASPLISSVPR